MSALRPTASGPTARGALAAAGGGTWTATLIDSAAAADLQSAASVLTSAVLDAASGFDIGSTAAATVASAVDAAASAELIAAAAVLVAQVAEAAAGEDRLAAATTRVAQLLEQAAGADLASGALPTVNAGSVREAAAALDIVLAAIAAVVYRRAPADVRVASRPQPTQLNLRAPRRGLGSILKPHD